MEQEPTIKDCGMKLYVRAHLDIRRYHEVISRLYVVFSRGFLEETDFHIALKIYNLGRHQKKEKNSRRKNNMNGD